MENSQNYNLLPGIKSPDDVKKLDSGQLDDLCLELRNKIIETVSANGGHLASNLGTVELTVALHRTFNSPDDKIIWDVGHQAYSHKLLTGRYDSFDTLRTENGISGFVRPDESEYDSFYEGHAGTSVSQAAGIAASNSLKGNKNYAVAVIGDGSFGNGMVYEAMNTAGGNGDRVIIVLNDNEMSISKNVGGISLFLSKARTRKFYKASNRVVKKIVNKIAPRGSSSIIRFIRKIKYSIKQLLMPTMLFEDMGFRYLGPVDGHNIEELENILKISKEQEGPVLVHVVTKKGKGYKPAEETPDKFHGVSAFDIETGKSIKAKSKDYSKAFGEKLVELAKNNEKIVAITAAMKDGTGLTEFAKEFPEKYFDVGIAEQHALTFAAGLAKEGMIPFVPIYSSFYQRGYDQVIHDICIQNLPVIMCVDRAGIVGNDGETHQGLLDLAFFKLIPNIVVMAPKDFKELEQMMDFAITLNKPVVIRYPRGGESDIKFKKHQEIKIGKSEILKQGKDVTIIGIGKTVSTAMEVANELEKEEINSEVINARFLKPLDKDKIIKSVLKTKKVVTIEDGTIIGGLGSSIKELLIDNQLEDVEIKTFGYPDKFVQHGSVGELEKLYGMDTKSITEEIKKEKITKKVLQKK